MSSIANTTAAAQAVEQLVTAVDQNRKVTYISTSALAFVAYDIITMLSMEIELIWKAKWSIPKVLYIFARYYGIIYLIEHFFWKLSVNESFSSCRHYFLFYSFGGDFLFTTVVNLILMLRIGALYKYNRRVIYVLIAMVLVELVVELYVTAKSALLASRGAYVSPPGIPLTGCLSSVEINAILLICAITPVVIFGPFAGVGLEWLIAIYSISGSRLVLNLRSEASHGRKDETITEGNTIALRTFHVTSTLENTNTNRSNCQ
ncbi:hypothetical protein EW145_g2711 [Phellinidium pouzarii]|uniref:DUF6533 domain-containing protein n=1 Tax=Phellinidium pouzarii TaxID=167371 RepID=A0A4S4L9Z6_9AGAM|nr:hypothetical protein EW145_g2711 [Phellinidium pouzarii]